MNENSEKIKYLIADTTAFINNVQLHDYAENILTVPDVINEVKNHRQIRRLVVLPFDLQVREPNAECLHYVTEFAKKTGDYASLSGIDMKVIALTYELEKEHVGTNHLRLAPIVARTVASKTKPEELLDHNKLAGFYTPDNDGDESSNEDDNDDDGDVGIDEEDQANLQEQDIKSKLCEENAETEKSHDPLSKEITDEELEKCFANLNCQLEADDRSCDILVPEKKDESDEGDEDEDDDAEDSDWNDNERSVDDLDDSGWITPSNVKKVQKQLQGIIDEDKVPIVACMSTDYAIQNVIKQISLNICALNGRVIKHVRTYILRCYACFKTTSIMTKQFCPNCGNKTLKRVAVSLDENGQQVIHINTRRPLTGKFKNKSLPRFQGGKHSRNPIIVEDQPMPKQMPSRVAKTKTNALNEDYAAGYSPFVMRDTDSKSAMLRSKGNIKQWARNNAYEDERRRRNLNRLVK